MAKMMVVSLAFALVVCGLLWSTAEAQGKTMVQDTYKAREPEGKRGVKDHNKASVPEGKRKDHSKDVNKESLPEGKTMVQDLYKDPAEGQRVLQEANPAEGKTMVQDVYKERALNEKSYTRGGSRRLINLQVSSHGVQEPIRGI